MVIIVDLQIPAVISRLRLAPVFERGCRQTFHFLGQWNHPVMNLTSRRPTYDLARRIAVHRADAAGRRFDVCQPTPRRNSTMQLHSGLRLTRREHYADIKSTSNATHGLAWRGEKPRGAARSLFARRVSTPVKGASFIRRGTTLQTKLDTVSFFFSFSFCSSLGT